MTRSHEFDVPWSATAWTRSRSASRRAQATNSEVTSKTRDSTSSHSCDFGDAREGDFFPGLKAASG